MVWQAAHPRPRSGIDSHRRYAPRAIPSDSQPLGHGSWPHIGQYSRRPPQRCSSCLRSAEYARAIPWRFLPWPVQKIPPPVPAEPGEPSSAIETLAIAASHIFRAMSTGQVALLSTCSVIVLLTVSAKASTRCGPRITRRASCPSASFDEPLRRISGQHDDVWPGIPAPSGGDVRAMRLALILPSAHRQRAPAGAPGATTCNSVKVAPSESLRQNRCGPTRSRSRAAGRWHTAASCGLLGLAFSPRISG